jgi:hypothetical protein
MPPSNDYLIYPELPKKIIVNLKAKLRVRVLKIKYLNQGNPGDHTKSKIRNNSVKTAIFSPPGGSDTKEFIRRYALFINFIRFVTINLR